MAVVIETTLGDITVDLYLEQRPVTCLNFLKLCKMKYYNYNLFHTIRSGFIAQTGDPTGEGSGGQSIFGLLEGPQKRFFSGEKMPKIRHTNAGLLSMVCTDDMMVGSQFFFTLAPDLDSLDGVHCVIGEVTEGHEVLRKLNEVICDETHRPYQDVRITHTVILEDPFNDPSGFRAPSRSPSPSAERLKGGRIAPDEELDEAQGKTAEEIQEMIEEKEAKARATILEIVGDLPDADIAPPENVLFVCKLNPVTTDEDLEIIFSRFGKIVSCEVIRDKKTGDSLQYAFIEFSDKKSCEDAYFKMDNVLIDDRRIHVDFSQSVSKMRWLGKGRGVQHFDDDGNIKGNHFQNKSKHGYDQDKNKDRYIDHRHRDKEKIRNNNDKFKEREVRGKRDGSDREKKEREHISRKRYENDRQHRARSRSEENHVSRNKHEREKHLRGRSRSRSVEKTMSNSDNLKNKPRNHKNSESVASSKQQDRLESHKHSKSDRNYTDRKKDDRTKSPSKPVTNNKEKVHESSVKKDNVDRKLKSNNSSTKRHRSSSRDDTRDKRSKKQVENVESKRNHKKSERENDRRVEPRTPSPTNEKKIKQIKSKKDVDKNKKQNSMKKFNDKKKRKPSTSSSDSDTSDTSSTSSDTSSSSDSDRKKKRLRRKRKHSTSSSSETSSTSSSTSDSSTSTSSSSDSERDRKKAKTITKKKIVKVTKKKP